MANEFTDHFKTDLATKQIDFANDVIKIVLMSSTFVFNAQNYLISSTSFTNYIIVTAVVTTAAIFDAPSLSGITISFTDSSWTTGSAFSSVGAIIYDDTIGHIIGFYDFGSVQDFLSTDTVTLTNTYINIGHF